MRKLSYLLPVLIIASLGGNTHAGNTANTTVTGDTMFREGRTWSILAYSMWPWFSQNTWHNLVEGSTMVNGTPWHRITQCSDPIPVSGQLAMLTRENGLGQVWALKDSNSTQECLIFDFSLQAGDSVVIHYPYLTLDSLMYYVHHTDSVQMNGSWKKRLQMTLWPDSTAWICDTWVEGYGSMVMGTRPYMLEVGCFFTLLCVRDYGNLTYMNPDYNNCYLDNTAVEEYRHQAITLAPNPVSDVSYFLSDQNIAGPLRLEVYNMPGKLEFAAESATLQGLRIKSTDLTPGLHFFKLQSSRGPVGIGKFLSQ